MSWFGNKVPDAILKAGIIVWIVWRCYSTHGCDNFILATALFAVMAIFVKRKTIVTRTLIRSYRVPALVLTTTVVVRAFVHVREEDGGETSFLNTVIAEREKEREREYQKRIYFAKLEFP